MCLSSYILPICIYIYLPIYPYISISIYMYQPTYLSVCPSTCLTMQVYVQLHTHMTYARVSIILYNNVDHWYRLTRSQMEQSLTRYMVQGTRYTVHA